MSNFILSNNFSKSKFDATLFIKHKKNDILLVQICIDDIIFGDSNVSLFKEFEKMMKSDFNILMMGELNFFLGLQIKLLNEGIFISQIKSIKKLLKKFDSKNAKSFPPPMSTIVKLGTDEGHKSVYATLYKGMTRYLLYLIINKPDIMCSMFL